MIRVLLVEDDPMVAELNRIYVGRVEGFEVAATAGNGQEALRLLRERPVELILLDVFMAGPTGIELLAEIRALDLDVDVILVTAARDTRTIGRALKLGAVDYLIKPFEFERLQQALETYRESRRLIQGQGALNLTLHNQLTILVVAMLTSKGASGVTGAGFITLAATLAVVNPALVPGMAIVLGIDKFMSECRALTNITGNGVATIFVSWWEGELDRDKLRVITGKPAPAFKKAPVLAAE